MTERVTTIDTNYTGDPGVAAAYLLRDGDELAFVETNTTHAVPRLLEAIASAGGMPEQVRYVIITHVHLDHAGGAGVLMDHCPNATLVAHPRAAPHVVDPSKLIQSARGVYGDTFDELYGEIRPVPEARVQIMEDGNTLSFGTGVLRFLHTRGHANHHFCVVDEAGGGIFTGDSFGIVYPALQRYGLYAFPSTTPTDFDPEAAHASVDRIVGAGMPTAWLTHFGAQTDLTGIAAQLHEQLEIYGAWVEEGDASGRDGEELDTWARDQVRARFREDLQRLGLQDTPAADMIWRLDADINAQGVAFAVKKRRFKRSRASG